MSLLFNIAVSIESGQSEGDSRAASLSQMALRLRVQVWMNESLRLRRDDEAQEMLLWSFRQSVVAAQV